MVYNTVWLICDPSFIMEGNIKSLQVTTVVGTFDTPSHCAVKLVVASTDNNCDWICENPPLRVFLNTVTSKTRISSMLYAM